MRDRAAGKMAAALHQSHPRQHALVGIGDYDHGQAGVVELAEDVPVGGGAVLRLVDYQLGVLGGQQRAEHRLVGCQVPAGMSSQLGASKVPGAIQTLAGLAGARPSCRVAGPGGRLRWGGPTSYLSGW